MAFALSGVMVRVVSWLRTICLLSVVVAGCSRDLRPQVADAIAEEIDAAQPAAAVSEAARGDVRGFYDLRAGASAWLDRRGPSGRADNAIGVLASAADHGLDPEAYGLTALGEQRQALEDDETSDGPESRVAALARFEVALTTALVALGHDVALAAPARGVTDGPGRETPDIAGALAAAVDNDDLADFLPAVQPQHDGYAVLQQALAEFRARYADVEWPRVEARALEPGDSGPAVASLRSRLEAAGLLTPGAAGDATVYDAAVEAAVADFQASHGLAADGVAGAATIAALNVPKAERLRQIGLNLARWRALPDDLGAQHILVNVPAFELVVRDDGRDALTMPVIVGAADTPTPLFSDEVETVVFSPYWHIPESIAVAETAAQAAVSPDYLRRQRIEVLRTSDSGRPRPVDPAEVDWDDPAEVSGLALRQRPGPGNSLGRVKFLFPNAHAVYLHDTPNHKLFGRPVRALSHGCVRVSEPAALAEYLLAGQDDWTTERIAAAMDAGSEQHVALQGHLPVHLVYFTTGLDDEGRLRFFPDIYGHDR